MRTLDAAEASGKVSQTRFALLPGLQPPRPDRGCRRGSRCKGLQRPLPPQDRQLRAAEQVNLSARGGFTRPALCLWYSCYGRPLLLTCRACPPVELLMGLLRACDTAPAAPHRNRPAASYPKLGRRIPGSSSGLVRYCSSPQLFQRRLVSHRTNPPETRLAHGKTEIDCWPKPLKTRCCGSIPHRS